VTRVWDTDDAQHGRVNAARDAAPIEKYRSSSQQRILRVLIALAGHEITGLTPGDVARAAEVTPSNATRDLNNLAIAGLAEQIQSDGRWRLGPKLIQIALSHTQGMDRASGRLAEVKQRYSREPK